MAKLTNKQKNELERVLRNLERAERYLFSDRTEICSRKSAFTTTLDYVNTSTGDVLVTVNKHYGSDLTGLKSGIEFLKSFLAGPKVESPESEQVAA